MSNWIYNMSNMKMYSTVLYKIFVVGLNNITEYELVAHTLQFAKHL